MKKRLTITLSDSVLENLEKMAKEMGLSKSAMISVALENYKKGQVKKKSRAGRRGFWIYYTWVNYTVWQKKSKILHFPTLSRFNSRRLGNEIGIDWCTNSGQSFA